MPGVSTPALGLPYPSLDAKPLKKTLIVYGGSSSVGMLTTQVATAAGIKVVAITSERNFGLSRECGAVEVFDYHRASFVKDLVDFMAGVGGDFVGIFDAVSTPDTYGDDLAILKELGGGHLACVHPPPTEGVPGNVKAGMIFAVDDVATPVWRDYVTKALEDRKLKCLPKPLVIGKGLKYVEEALKKCKQGVSARKLVVEL